VEARKPNKMPEVLLVEDDPTMRSLLKALLEIEGYQVVNSRDHAQVVELVKQAPPDLVLLDVNLREYNGLDLLEQLRQHYQADQLPVILSSGTDFRDEGLERGANDFIMKPYMPEELIAKIRKMTGGRA
jgi:DNA-binding response OmpR family regulator